ncbi:schlafen-like protein 1 [Podarcis muralis]
MEATTIPEIIVECALPVDNVDQATEQSLTEAKAEEEVEEDEDSGQARPYVLYVGNLNPKYSREVLCSMLKDILGMASVTLQRHNIEVVKKRRQAYAFVQVATDSNLEHVIKQLLLASETESELTKELVKKGKNLVVGHGKTFAFHAKGNRESDSVGSSSETFLGGQGYERSRKLILNEHHLNRIRKFPQYSCMAERPEAFLSGTRSDSAIVQKAIVGKECLFYGASMGSETRNVEFKRGSGEYLAGTLKHHVRKYMCAFLNSEGGSLFVGVEDNGMVRGVRCDHKDEDRTRLLIDSLLKGFKPQVFPSDYTLSFIPVIKAEDTGIFLKVIRLSVHPPKQNKPLLYETDQGEVYMRREGSIQGPLTGSAIQEWCRQKWTEEIKKLEVKIESLLKEKEAFQQQNTSNATCCFFRWFAGRILEP